MHTLDRENGEEARKGKRGRENVLDRIFKISCNASQSCQLAGSTDDLQRSHDNERV